MSERMTSKGWVCSAAACSAFTASSVVAAKVARCTKTAEHAGPRCDCSKGSSRPRRISAPSKADRFALARSSAALRSAAGNSSGQAGFFLRELDCCVQCRAAREGELNSKGLEARQAGYRRRQRLSQEPNHKHRERHPKQVADRTDDARYLVPVHRINVRWKPTLRLKGG